MRFDWIPASAALLVMGALALALGTIMTPTGTDTVEVVQRADGRWLAVAVISFLASVMLTLGLPAALTLVDRRHLYLGMASALTLGAGFIGIAGYAMLLAAFRALIVTGVIDDAGVDKAASEVGFQVLLTGWIVAFAVGEALFALVLLLSDVPRVVPLLVLVHVASAPLEGVLPDVVERGAVLLFACAFSAVGIIAATPERIGRLA